jgi:hypothetical protein
MSWDKLVKDYCPLMDRKFRNPANNEVYTYLGILHAKDDWYHALYNSKVNPPLILFSCVGYLERHYELIEEEEKVPPPSEEARLLYITQRWRNVLEALAKYDTGAKDES